MQWTPDTPTLQTLATILQQSLGSSKERKAATGALNQAREHPDYCNYLIYLLCYQVGDVPIDIRAAAGLVLKNSLWLAGPSQKEYIKQEVPKALFSSEHNIANIASIVTTQLVSQVKLQQWPEILGQLMQMLEGEQHSQEAAITTLARICEDNAKQLDTDLWGPDTCPTNILVPRLIALCKSPYPKVRANSVLCLNEFIPLQCQPLWSNIGEFLQVVFTLAEDPNPDTRKNVATAFTHLLRVRESIVLPHLDGIVDYCLHCLKDDEENVALESSEFLLTLGESWLPNEVVLPQLPKIVPRLLEAMVYSEMDLFMLENMDEDDANVADKIEDIKPVHNKTKDSHNSKSKRPQESTDEDEEEEEDDDSGDPAEWNLRKCSAAALDVFAAKYPHQVFQYAREPLMERVNHQDWQVKESAVLAFGAISMGCLRVRQLDFVPDLVAFLLKTINDEHAALREVTCWTLGRYNEPITATDGLFQQVFEALVRASLDNNKKVQEAGCCAVSVFAEFAGSMLVPLAEPLIMHFQQCFAKYQVRNMISLYECIQTVVGAIYPALSDPRLLEQLMSPLVKAWQTHEDGDRELLPLLECLAAIATHLGEGFAPYAITLFDRSINLIKNTFVMEQRFQMDPVSCEAPEYEFIVCGLDAIDGLVQGLAENSKELLNRCQDPSFLDILHASFVCSDIEVRQSAFALAGDMAIWISDFMIPRLSDLMPAILSQIEGDVELMTDSVANNAVWCVGELALRLTREQLAPYFEDILSRLRALFAFEHCTQSVLENAGIAFGRLAIPMAQDIAPSLGLFIRYWLSVMPEVEETSEKDTSFRGICLAISANPAALSEPGLLKALLSAFANYHDPSPQLKMMISKVLGGYAVMLPNFDALVAELGSESAEILKNFYGY